MIKPSAIFVPDTSIRLGDGDESELWWVESVEGDRVTLRRVVENKITIPSIPWLKQIDPARATCPTCNGDGIVKRRERSDTGAVGMVVKRCPDCDGGKGGGR